MMNLIMRNNLKLECKEKPPFKLSLKGGFSLQEYYSDIK